MFILGLLRGMSVLDYIFVCLWTCCTVDKMAVVLSFADVCSSFFVIYWCVFEYWLFIRFQLLAHLSRRLIGELIVYEGIRRPSVVRRPSVRPSSVNIFKRHLL